MAFILLQCGDLTLFKVVKDRLGTGLFFDSKAVSVLRPS